MPNPFCEALKMGERIVCLHCDKSWAVNDPFPPDCEFERFLDAVVRGEEQS